LSCRRPLRRALCRFREPAENVELHEAGVADDHALLFEQPALDRRTDRIEDRDPTPRPARFADHALPWQLLPARVAALQRGRRDPRTTGKPGELGDPPVGRDRARWNRANHRVHGGEQLLEMRAVAAAGHRGKVQELS